MHIDIQRIDIHFIRESSGNLIMLDIGYCLFKENTMPKKMIKKLL